MDDENYNEERESRKGKLKWKDSHYSYCGRQIEIQKGMLTKRITETDRHNPSPTETEAETKRVKEAET